VTTAVGSGGGVSTTAGTNITGASDVGSTRASRRQVKSCWGVKAISLGGVFCVFFTIAWRRIACGKTFNKKSYDATLN
jgi:hypothetical protein